MIAIDFETYYTAEYSVSRMGYWAYTHDKRFRAYLVGWANAAGSGACAPEQFEWYRLQNEEVIAHNAEFDRAVFSRLRELGIVPRDVHIRHWHCTACLSAYLQCPRDLAGAAEAILGVQVSKDARARAEGVSTPDLFGSMARYCQRDAEICWQLWCKASKLWPAEEQRLAQLTGLIGRKGVRIDQEYARQQMEQLKTKMEAAALDIPWRGRAALTSPIAFKDECASAGIKPPGSTDSGDDACQAWLQQHAGTVPAKALQAMQLYRRANRSKAVLQALLDRVMPTGRAEAHLLYCGASTGRWSGGGHGLNMQNLTTDTDLCDLRGVIVPEYEHKLVVIDLCQIEARILLWLAGDSETLDLIRQGVSVYEAHARATMGWKGGELKKENPALYKLAKMRVLGLGYGCGAAQFRGLAARAGLALTEDEAKRAVHDYRTANARIVRLWDQLDAAFRAHDGRTFYNKLPSGRYLIYRNCNAKDSTAEQVKGVRTKVYGGLLCENMVQAIARDIFADGLLSLVDACARPILLVHDEVVLEVPEEMAGAALRFAVRMFSAPPAWAVGLPIASEGRILDRYSK